MFEKNLVNIEKKARQPALSTAADNFESTAQSTSTTDRSSVSNEYELVDVSSFEDPVASSTIASSTRQVEREIAASEPLSIREGFPHMHNRQVGGSTSAPIRRQSGAIVDNVRALPRKQRRRTTGFAVTGDTRITRAEDESDEDDNLGPAWRRDRNVFQNGLAT